MSLDQVYRLATAAGYSAVPDEDLDFGRPDLCPDRPSLTPLQRFQTPDAPAPRRLAGPTANALMVVEPMWRSQPALNPTWAASTLWGLRELIGRFGRGVPA
jgi:hypothetical protein